MAELGHVNITSVYSVANIGNSDSKRFTIVKSRRV